MRVVTDNRVSLGWLVSRVGKPRLTATIILKGTYLLQPGGPALPADEPDLLVGDLPYEGEGEKGLRYPSDFAPFKPRADVVLIATAHAPRGEPVPHLDVRWRVGRLAKSLRVVGNRHWRRSSAGSGETSPPVPFTSMPLVYERAFGGAGFPQNPLGCGLATQHLPNLEELGSQIRRPEEWPGPAGFGPRAPSWEPRCTLVGTYDSKWLKDRWPWFPDDFDWGYFNAAPPDQQVEGYLRGDEELAFENLHPEHRVYRSQMPAVRARAFVQERMEGQEADFREVTLHLDTLWIDLDNSRLNLVWRGVTPVRSLKANEIERFVGVTEPLYQPARTKEAIQAWVLRRVEEEEGEAPEDPAEAAERSAERAADAAAAQEMAAMEQELADLDKEFEELDTLATKTLENQKAQLIAEGYDPKLLEGPARPQTVADVRALLATQIALLQGDQPREAAKLAELAKEFDHIEQMDEEFAALSRDEDPPVPTRETVQAAVAQGQPLTNTDLSGLNLARLDLTGADLTGVDLSQADLSGSTLIRARLLGADLSSANLTGVDFTGAILDEADFTRALLAGAKFAEASLAGTSLSQLDLKGLDFSGCAGMHADFSGSQLGHATFERAKLPRADFSKANLESAVFTGAELQSAEFDGAVARGIVMEMADITGLRASERADFTGGNFRNVRAVGSIWETSVLDIADFSRGALAGALLGEASLNRTRFDRADLSSATFDDAMARQAVLTYANLLRASFERADLTDADLQGANLYEAGFWEAILDGANLRAANLKGTTLA